MSQASIVPSVFLRSDLAQLSDTELAARLEDAWRAHDAAGNRRGWFSTRCLGLFHSMRGPIRHPRAYRFLTALTHGSGGWLDVLFAVALSDKSAERFLRTADPATDAHLSLCEIRDILDEVERRVTERQAKAS